MHDLTRDIFPGRNSEEIKSSASSFPSVNIQSIETLVPVEQIVVTQQHLLGYHGFVFVEDDTLKPCACRVDLEMPPTLVNKGPFVRPQKVSKDTCLSRKTRQGVFYEPTTSPTEREHKTLKPHACRVDFKV